LSAGKDLILDAERHAITVTQEKVLSLELEVSQLKIAIEEMINNHAGQLEGKQQN